jgi:hypothetical protein
MIARRIRKIRKPFELYGRLQTDISFQNGYFINNVDMVLRFISNQSRFWDAVKLTSTESAILLASL